MTVLSLEHAEPRVEGYLCRHFIKIRPGVFVGRISATRRTAIWKHILEEQPNIDAVLCYQAEHGQVRFESNGEPTRKITEIDGIQFIARVTGTSLWKEFLAKPSFVSRQGAYHPGKPLWEHMLEVGIFAKIILTNSSYKSLAKTLASFVSDITGDQLVNTACYLAAMHDIGKVSPYFQAKMGADEKALFGASNIKDVGFRHEKYSRDLLRVRFLKSRGFDRRTRARLSDVIGDHHQCKPENGENNFPQGMNENLLFSVIDELEAFIASIFPPTSFLIQPDCENAFCQLLSGLIRLSDWSASSFAYDLSSEGMSNEEYIRSVISRCEQYIENGGLKEWTPKDHYGYPDLFPTLSSEAVLRPLQLKMIDVVRNHSQAECIVIESEPGSGKTEAGLYAAMNLLSSQGLQGLYFALPTGATAEAMLPRLQALKDATGAWADTDLRLLTGMAWLKHSSDDNDAKLDWTKSGPRKLFSKLACGTVDQLMAAGEMLKAGDMRLLALSNKVLIIDEFHAYDAYMMEILLIVLRWAKAMHVPVIILSATLRQKSLRQICEVYSDSVPEVMSDGYPLITVAENNAISQHNCASTFCKQYTMQHIGQSELVPGILESVKDGRCTLYISNTVKRALSVYEQLKDIKSDDVELCIYTASTTPENREKMGADIVYRYGKQGKADGKRPKKSILIATQIVEMSMDVDFDTLFSDLAPVDSILQRIGRMRRHDDAGTVRESGFESIFYLVLPDKNQYGWALPYSEPVLHGAEDVLATKKQICVPGDIRPLIEESYEKAGEEWIHEEMRESAAAYGNLIGKPEDNYGPKSMLKTMAETRLSDRQSVNILCLSDEEIETLVGYMQAGAERSELCREWCLKAIENCSIRTYRDKLGRLDVVDFEDDSASLPIWVEAYTVVRDRPEYWHGDNTFFV